MYSPCKRVLQVAHLKHQTCHWESSAIRAWPSTISLEQPVHSRQQQQQKWEWFINEMLTVVVLPTYRIITRWRWWRVCTTVWCGRTRRRTGSNGFHWWRWCCRHDGNLDAFRTQNFFACKGHSFPGRERLPNNNIRKQIISEFLFFKESINGIRYFSTWYHTNIQQNSWDYWHFKMEKKKAFKFKNRIFYRPCYHGWTSSKARQPTWIHRIMMVLLLLRGFNFILKFRTNKSYFYLGFHPNFQGTRCMNRFGSYFPL